MFRRLETDFCNDCLDWGVLKFTRIRKNRLDILEIIVSSSVAVSRLLE